SPRARTTGIGSALEGPSAARDPPRSRDGLPSLKVSQIVTSWVQRVKSQEKLPTTFMNGPPAAHPAEGGPPVAYAFRVSLPGGDSRACPPAGQGRRLGLSAFRRARRRAHGAGRSR